MHLLILLAASISFAGPELERHEFRAPVFGIEARIVVYAANEAQARTAADQAFARVADLDFALSDWRDDGVLAELARRAGKEPMVVPAELAECLDTAIKVAWASDGAFDPTAAPLTHLWRTARANGVLPDAAAVETARGKVIFLALELERGATDTVRLMSADMALDLGGVAKGYAAEEMLRTLEHAGVPVALVDLGGDLALGAPPPGRDGWRVRVGLQDLELANTFVATSGDSEQFLEADGQRWSHVVDPRTGWALTHGRSATVIAPRGALADALASAATVMEVRAAERAVDVFDGARLFMHHPDARNLFDGATLAGWTPRGGRYDGDARWSVEDGAIVGRTGNNGAGGLLYTEEVFSAFELELEVSIDYPFDSGVFFNMLPSAAGLRGYQVTLDHRPGGEIGALYSDGYLVHSKDAALRRTGWSHVRVRATGFDARVEAWIDGEKVLDHTQPPDSKGFARHGHIGLQVHDAAAADRDADGDKDSNGRAARFRHVRIRELAVLEQAANLPASNDPIDPLEMFNGWDDWLKRGAEGFQITGDTDGYRFEAGELIIPAHGSGHIGTEQTFGDFELSLEFQLAPFANSGLFLRAAPGDSNPAFSGAEIQLIDDAGWEVATGQALTPTQTTGSLYGSVPAPTWKRLRPPGEWNLIEVHARGPRLALALNGLVLWDVDTHALTAEPPFRERARAGFIGLQRYGAPAVSGEWSVRARRGFVHQLPQAR